MVNSLLLVKYPRKYDTTFKISFYYLMTASDVSSFEIRENPKMEQMCYTATHTPVKYSVIYVTLLYQSGYPMNSFIASSFSMAALRVSVSIQDKEVRRDFRIAFILAVRECT